MHELIYHLGISFMKQIDNSGQMTHFMVDNNYKTMLFLFFSL